MYFFIFLFLIHGTNCVIYNLNETEYDKMPPMFHLDKYAPCVHEPGGVYCTAEISLVSDTPSELMTMIEEYSKRREMHFNHSRLVRGICVTRTCKEHLSQNTSADLNLVLEGCLNDTLWKKYKLKSKIVGDILCNDLDNKMDIDYGDIAVAVLCAVIFILNVLGSVYDFLFLYSNKKDGNKLLLCFSVRRNWKKLVTRVTEGPELRLKRLKGFNGIRNFAIILVIIEHSFLPFVVGSENTHDYEIKYSDIFIHVFVDGSVIVQTFFVMSGCLLAYNLQRLSEKKKLNWRIIPMGLLVRYLRLTPSYAVVLAFTTTWLRFTGSGPLWQTVVGVEVKDCRKDGWLNLIYLNNYIDNSQCMPQTWYLAADMQLYVVGLFIFGVTQSKIARKIIMSVLFVISLVVPACHTYFQNLDANLIMAPEVIRDYFVRDPTFNHVYKRGHTNLASYVIGLALGLYIYHLQKTEFSIEKYKKNITLKMLYWATWPMVWVMCVLGGAFYMGGVNPPLILKAIYSGISKPILGLIVAVIILGMAFKLENVYRGILEWNGWSSPSRVSYSAYILHVLYIRVLTGSRSTLVHVSVAHMLLIAIGTLLISYSSAYPFWICVEAPAVNLSKLIVPLKSKSKDDKVSPEVVSGKSERTPV